MDMFKHKKEIFILLSYFINILPEVADGFYNAVKSLEMERKAALKPLSMKRLNVSTFSLLTSSFYSLVQNLAEVLLR